MSVTSTPSAEAPPVTVYYGLAEACRRFFDEPNRPHPTALIRWGTKGTGLTNGQRHYLELKRMPGKWLVSEEAIRRFLDILTADRCGGRAPRPRDVDPRVDAALDAAGF